MFKYSGRPVESAADMAFDFDEDGYLDPVEEAELMRLLEDDDEDDEFDEDDFDEDDDWDEDDDFDDDF